MNTFKKPSVNAEEVKCYEDLFNTIVADQGWYIVATDSAEEANILHDSLKEQGIDTVLITGDNDKSYTFDDHQRIIFSPKIVYGIDSVKPRNVYCVYRCKSIQPTHMLQQVGRARSIKKLLYYFHPKKYFRKCPYNTVHDYLGAMKTAEQLCVEQFEIMGGECADWFFTLYTGIKYTQQCFETNTRLYFKMLLIENGFTDNDLLCYSERNADNFKLEKASSKEERIKRLEMENNKLNEFLKIPDEHVDTYKELFVQRHLFNEHMNVVYLIMKDKQVVYDKIAKGKDFNIAQIHTDYYKVKFVHKVCDIVGANLDNEFSCQNTPSAEVLQELWNEYVTIFRVRGKDTTVLNFSQWFQKILKSIIPNLMKTSRKKKQINGVRQWVHSHSIEESALQYHRKLHSFRTVNMEGIQFMDD